MRVLFINRWVGVQKGGTESHIKELATRLAERGHRIAILTSAGRELEKIDSSIRKLYIRRVPGERPYSGQSGIGTVIFASIFATTAFVTLLRLAARGYKFDVVSVHFALEAFLMRLVRPILRLPFVFVFEGYSDVEARQALHANLRVAISNHVAQECRSRFSYLPQVIPIGIDFKRFRRDEAEVPKQLARKRLGLPAKSGVVLSVGRLSPDKGLDTLARAAHVVSAKFPETIVVVVGDGSYKTELQGLIQENRLNNFVLVGRVEDSELPFYYWAADLFVLAETNEGFSGGLVLLEAMSAGLPLIATKVGGIPETVGGAGILIPPRDENALAEAIGKLLTDEDLQTELSNKGLLIAEQRDWANIMKSYESLYCDAYESSSTRKQASPAPPIFA